MKIPRRILTLFWMMAVFISCFSIPAFADEATLYGIGFVNADGLRLRQQPNTVSAVAASAAKNECVVVIDAEGDWYHVSYNLQEGYMHKDYLNVLTVENAELGYGKVSGSQVNLRKGPGTSYSRVATANKGDKCYILGLNQGWFKVIFQSQTCYIRSDLLELTEIPYENKASANAPQFFRLGKSIGTVPGSSALKAENNTSPVSSGVSGSQILENAKQYLGTPYVSGGASPSGFDCSGFVYYVLKNLGYSPARTPSAQYGMGTAVDPNAMQPGDIVFFAGTAASGISHVGIYAGNGQFIHAPNSRSVVSYSDLTGGYWAQHFYGARRMGS